MIAVIYIPSDADPLSGRIDHQIQGRLLHPHDILDPYVEVFEDRPDWDTTHEVVNMQVVPLSADQIAADALEFDIKRLRARRDALLRDYVDSINPMRWSDFSPEQKAEVSAYRDALRHWPATETDPANPTEPPPPAFLRKPAA
jgi:hypothetical protein